MSYSQRLATVADINSLASLWRVFAIERVKADPSLRIKSDFDFAKYVGYQLGRPLSFCFVLECEQGLVGFLSIYFYDEAPPSQLKVDFEMFDNPFIPRRVGAVLGLYIGKEHQQPSAIKLLIDAALIQADKLQVTDIDLLVSIEQTGLHALLKRYDFTESAIQYTKHFDVIEGDLPNLHPTFGDHQKFDAAANQAIPLRDPLTNIKAKNLLGETIYLEPLRDDVGNIITTSRGLPIYPLPLRDPQTNKWVFDQQGNLVVCPILRNEEGELVEQDGLPQFHSPVYGFEDGQLFLKRDELGNYCFSKP